jgi:hypothetical protein
MASAQQAERNSAPMPSPATTERQNAASVTPKPQSKPPEGSMTACSRNLTSCEKDCRGKSGGKFDAIYESCYQPCKLSHRNCQATAKAKTQVTPELTTAPAQPIEKNCPNDFIACEGDCFTKYKTDPDYTTCVTPCVAARNACNATQRGKRHPNAN